MRYLVFIPVAFLMFVIAYMGNLTIAHHKAAEKARNDRDSAFMQSCLQDWPEYECRVKYRQAYPL